MDLSDRNELRWLSAILADVRSAAPDADILVVGAIARDLLLRYAHGVPTPRATQDIDLGVAVAGWEEFRRIRGACLNAGNFTAGRSGNHRIVHQSNVTIDLIPFDGIEQEGGSIRWPEDGTVIGVLGFREARATAVNILLPEGIVVATVCLPMLAILKLMAWSARHTYTPRKDASDLFQVLANYLNDVNTKRLYEVGAHLLQTEDFDYEAAGAWLAGHDAARCITMHSERPRRVLDAVKLILGAEADPGGGLHLVGELGLKAPAMLKLLSGFRDGMNDVLS